MNVVIPQAAAFSELASRLQADASGEARREYHEMFSMALTHARRRLQEPQTADEFDMEAALMEGAQLCDEVISAVWHALHP